MPAPFAASFLLMEEPFCKVIWVLAAAVHKAKIPPPKEALLSVISA